MTQIEVAERNRKIKYLALNGKTVDEITEIIGIKKYRVIMILRAYNVKAAKTSHKLECEKAQKIIKELESGTKQIDIAKKLNVSRQYVNQVKNSYLAIKQTNEK